MTCRARRPIMAGHYTAVRRRPYLSYSCPSRHRGAAFVSKPRRARVGVGFRLPAGVYPALLFGVAVEVARGEARVVRPAVPKPFDVGKPGRCDTPGGTARVRPGDANAAGRESLLGRVCKAGFGLCYLAALSRELVLPAVGSSHRRLISDGDCGYRSGGAPEGGALPPRAAGTWSRSSNLRGRSDPGSLRRTR